MKIVFLTNVISPHQLPLARAIVEHVGENNYRYIYTERLHGERTKMGWNEEEGIRWCCHSNTEQNPSLLDADILHSELRILKIFEKRNELKKKTFYSSERWFKPPVGILRLVHPRYFLMVRRFFKLLQFSFFILLPQGVHAARDFARLIGLFKGDLRCLFRAPKVAFESRPGGVIVSLNEAIQAKVLSKDEIVFGKKYGFVQIPKEHWNKLTPTEMFAKMRMWGYFVTPSEAKAARRSLPIEHPLRILWVGRMLDWKRADVLVRAISPHPDLKRADVSLHLYGDGPMKKKLKKLARGAPNIEFHDFVPIDKVRQLMREHDVYVLPSNGYEGWGAVVSEALEEGLKVLGTIEAGATATILPPTNLFKAGDVLRLRMLLADEISDIGIGCWTADYAAKVFTALGNLK